MSKPSDLKIVAISNGFVYIGRVTRHADLVEIRGAACIRVWGTTSGLGQIARNGPTDQTKLDPSPTINIEKSRVLFYVDCVESAWSKVKLTE